MSMQPGKILTAAMLRENPDGTVTIRWTETLAPGAAGNTANFGPIPYPDGVTFTARPHLSFAARAVTDNTNVVVSWLSSTDGANLYIRTTLVNSASSSSAMVVDITATGFLA